MVHDVTDANFKTEVEDYKGTVLADFWAAWCQPCKRLAPVVHALSDELPDVKFVQIETDVNMELAQQFGIRGIPTLILFKDGKVSKITMGSQSKDALREWITK